MKKHADLVIPSIQASTSLIGSARVWFFKSAKMHQEPAEGAEGHRVPGSVEHQLLAGSHSAFRPGFRQVTIGRVISLSTKKVSKKKLVKKMGLVRLGIPKMDEHRMVFHGFCQVKCRVFHMADFGYPAKSCKQVVFCRE